MAYLWQKHNLRSVWLLSPDLRFGLQPLHLTLKAITQWLWCIPDKGTIWGLFTTAPMCLSYMFEGKTLGISVGHLFPAVPVQELSRCSEVSSPDGLTAPRSDYIIYIRGIRTELGSVEPRRQAPAKVYAILYNQTNNLDLRLPPRVACNPFSQLRLLS